MPGTNAGTGQPIMFRCAAARREWTEPRTHHTVVRTGRSRPSRARKFGLRTLPTQHEYRCTCGHVGWSNHTGVLAQPVSTLDTV